jgi:type VI secretion system protein ImpK
MIEVISYRDRILKEDPTATYDIIHRNLSSIIKEILDTPKGASFDKKNKDAVYIMVSIADELFLNLDWIGKQYWEEHMLEYEFFKTQIAGNQIFNRINELLQNRNFPADIAKIYLETLAFGFKGKFRGTSSETEEIKALRKQLYDFIEKSTKTIFNSHSRLFQKQYACTLPTIPRQLLPDFNQLLYVCCGIIFVFFIFGSIAWMIETKDLNLLLDEISAIALRE